VHGGRRVAPVEKVRGGRISCLDGDPIRFRLGIEARRIETAFVYDMAAVAVSNIQPLMHQLESVYGEFLLELRPTKPKVGSWKLSERLLESPASARLSL